MPSYTGIPSQDDEMRAVRRAMKKAKTKQKPGAAEEIAPGKYRESPPESLPDPGIRLASASRRSRRARIAAIRGEVA